MRGIIPQGTLVWDTVSFPAGPGTSQPHPETPQSEAPTTKTVRRQGLGLPGKHSSSAWDGSSLPPPREPGVGQHLPHTEVNEQGPVRTPGA